MNVAGLMVGSMLAVALLGSAPLGALASAPGDGNPGGAGYSAAAASQEAGDALLAGGDQGENEGAAAQSSDQVLAGGVSHEGMPPESAGGQAGAEDGATLEGAAPSAGYSAEASPELGLGPWLAQYSSSAVERAYQAALEIARTDMALAAMLVAAVAVLAASSGAALLIAAKAATGSRLSERAPKKTMVTKRRKLDVGF